MTSVNLIPHPDCYNYRSWADVISRHRDLAAIDISRFASIEQYINRAMNATSGNRLRYSQKQGYTSRILSWEERNQRLDEIHLINTSMQVRQGREMAESYREKPKPITGTDRCSDHYSYFLGTFDRMNILVAYISVSVCGEMTAASQILCHADHLKPGAMLNTWVKFIELSRNAGKKFAVYGHWADGRDGLRHWKQAVGLSPAIMEEIK